MTRAQWSLTGKQMEGGKEGREGGGGRGGKKVVGKGKGDRA